METVTKLVLKTNKKAGHGLDKIPQTVDEWRMSAINYGLAQRNLSHICEEGIVPLKSSHAS